MGTELPSKDQIFNVAAELLDPIARADYLDDICADDPELRLEIDDLLKRDSAEASFLKSPVAEYAVTTDQPQLSERPGTVIGPYKLLQQIGEGGMGVVFMAEQTEPLQRTAALKIIKPGMDTRQVIARFEAERQAVAMMDHPNIAKVLDAGTTDSGRPYFVMELVKGIAITKYCDEKHLPLRARLELFVEVCQAVQHAHQKGIIHRDIKPNNVLVAEYDNRAVPKVIDFGVAKATVRRLTERTMFTEFGQVLGTMEYMSPEQAKLNQLDIDTRSDIYSLGVLLYELLTGSTPFEGKRLHEAAFDEMLRIIREEEPQKPSTRLSSGDALPSIAANRGLEPLKLNRLVQGELDWIVMKCLEKDRNRRYETANGFAQDLERYLADEPVQACPPSAAYRLKKFVRRNRAAFATAAVVTIALVTGTVVSTWQAIRATRAEHLAAARLDAEVVARTAEAQQRKVAEVQRREAEKQRAEAEANFQKARQAVDEYFTLVSESTLFDVPGMEPLRRDLLEAALRFYKESANQRSDDPDVLANLAVTYVRVAVIYSATNRNDDAIATLGQALDAIDRLRHEYPTATAAHCKLAGFWKGLRTTTTATVLPRNTEKAFQMLQRLAETWESLAAENPSIVEFQNDLAAIENHKGRLLDAAGKPSAATPFYLKAQAIWEKLVREHPTVPEYKADLASNCYIWAKVHAAAGREEEAEELNRRNVELLEQLVAENPKSPQYRGDLAWSLMRNGVRLLRKSRAQDAEPDFRRAVAINFALVEEFPAFALYRENMVEHVLEFAECLTSTGRTEEAISLFRKALPVIDQHAADATNTGNYKSQLAEFYGVFSTMLRQSGSATEAAEAFVASCDLYKKLDVEFPNEPSYRNSLTANYISLAEAALSQSNYDVAEATLRQAIQTFDELATAHAAMPYYRRYGALFRGRLARLQTMTDRAEEASQTLQQTIDAYQKIIEEFPQYGDLGLVYVGLASALNGADQRDQAEAAYGKGVELVGNNAVVLNGIALGLATGPEPRFYEPRWAVELAKQAVGLEPNNGIYWQTLGIARYRAGDSTAAIAALEKVRELGSAGDSFEWFPLAMAHWQLEHEDEARQWYDKAVEWMDKNMPTHVELRRFRAEAAELLGIENQH